MEDHPDFPKQKKTPTLLSVGVVGFLPKRLVGFFGETFTFQGNPCIRQVDDH